MKKKKSILIFISGFILLMLLYGQNVIAVQSNQNQTGNGLNASTNNTPVTNSVRWDEIIKFFVGPSLIAFITGFLTIINFIVERKYELKEITIEPITELVESESGYSIFICEGITKAGTNVEIVDRENVYYYDVKIKIDRPARYRPIFNLAIKQLIFESDGYRFRYTSKDIGTKKWKKCNAAENTDTCSLILKPPCVKPKDKELINTIGIFQNPQKITIYMTWFANATWYSVSNRFVPRSNIILFRMDEHQSERTIIRIVSNQILKGKLK